MRTASSTAISSKGFIDILTLARSTPVPSDLTRTLTLKSTTRFTGTRIFMRLFLSRTCFCFPPNAHEARYLASARWHGRYCRQPRKSMVPRLFERLSGPSPGAVEERYTAPPHEQDQDGTCRQTPDMRPPGDTLLGIDQEVGELRKNPKAERPIRGDLDRNPPQREHPDLNVWVQDQIGGDDAGHRAAGADQRELRVRHDPGMDDRREDPAHQVEHDEAEMAHGILDIVAEHPKEQHVAEEMNPAAVQEHVGEKRETGRHQERRHDGFVAEAVPHEFGRNGGEGREIFLVERDEPAGLKDEVDGDVEDDQRDRHVLIVDAL